MKRIGIVLVVLGVLSLVWGGFGYDRTKTLVDLGPIQATTTEHHSVPILPIVSGIVIVGGLLLLLIPARRLR